MKKAATSRINLTSTQHQTLVQLMAEWVAAYFRPFSPIEDQGFRAIMEQVKPRYQPVSRAVVRKELFRQEREFYFMLRAELSQVSAISATSDLWTDAEGRGYCSLMLHYFYDQWLYQFRILVCHPFRHRHSGKYIAAVFSSFRSRICLFLF